MIAYAARTGTKKNLAALRSAGWRILLSPIERRDPPPGFRFAIDNGAWTAYQKGEPWNEAKFFDLVDRHGGAADFIVIPDVVGDAMRTMKNALQYLPRLAHFKLLLLAVQDGSSPRYVGSFLQEYDNVGLFLGGTTEYKLREMYAWGVVAQALGCHYHVARVNTRRRIRLAHEAGAHSIDGTSVTRFASTLPLLEDARRQPSLLTPGRCA